MLIPNANGHYRFLRGIEPYSCGVVADPGWEIVHVTAADPPTWSEGFDWIDSILRQNQVDRSALCAVELRSPAPFTMDGFVDFNRGYCAILEQWQLLVGSDNPVARTNVAPLMDPPRVPSMHAFSFVRPNPRPAASAEPTFVVAGAGELRDALLETERIVRRGDISPHALLEKATYVLDVMEERLRGLGANWNGVTTVDVYTVHPLEPSLRDLILRRIGPAARHGITWHVSRPPVIEIEFEMDLRGVAKEWRSAR